MKRLLILYPYVYLAVLCPLASGQASPQNNFTSMAAAAGRPAFASDAIQYVSANGNDTNDGLSWDTAKRTVYAALMVLPGGRKSPPTAGKGTVFLSGNGVSSNPISGCGIWLMSSADPNYANPPACWLRLSGALSFTCQSGQNSPGNGHVPACLVDGGSSADTNHPVLWLSGGGPSIHLQGLTFPGRGRTVNIGVCSDGTTSSCGSVNVLFEAFGAGGPHNATLGPTIFIGGGTFWIFFRDYVIDGNFYQNGYLNENSASVLIKPGKGSASSGLIFFEDGVLNNGNIQLDPANSGTGVSVDHLTCEDQVEGCVWLRGGGTGPNFLQLHDIVVSDCVSAPCWAVENDGYPAGTISVADAGPLFGPMAVQGAGTANGTALPATQHQAGFFDVYPPGPSDNLRVAGQIDEARALFGPVAVRSPNLATQLATSWSNAGTISPVWAPDGTNNAGRPAVPASAVNVTFYSHSGLALNVGDYYVFGVWAKSQTGNGFAGNTPLTLNLHTRGDTCSNDDTRPRGYSSNSWSWYYAVCKLATVASGTHSVSLDGRADPTHIPQYFAPILLYLPAASYNDNEAYELAQNLASYSAFCPSGTICGLADHRTVQPTANGATWTQGSISEVITLSSTGTTTDSVANLLPANSIIEAVVARVTTTVATATDWKLGDATTAGRFSAANSSLTAGTTQVGLAHVDQRGPAGPRQTSAAKLRITTTGTASAGAIRVTVFYRQFAPPVN